MQIINGSKSIRPSRNPEHDVLSLKLSAHQTISAELYFGSCCIPGYWIRFKHNFWATKQRHYFSYVGPFYHGHINSADVSTISWLQGIYRKFSWFETKEVTQCELLVPNNVLRDFTIKTCWNLSVLSNLAAEDQKQYIFIETNKEPHQMTFHRKIPDRYPSWMNASDICEGFRGQLPSITSRDDLEELMAVFKLSENLPHTEAIYVGLKWRMYENQSQVIRAFIFAFM